MATNANTSDSAALAQKVQLGKPAFAAWSCARYRPRPRHRGGGGHGGRQPRGASAASGSVVLVAGWWALVWPAPWSRLWVADRAARRLTPLAALLDLAVLFPAARRLDSRSPGRPATFGR